MLDTGCSILDARCSSLRAKLAPTRLGGAAIPASYYSPITINQSPKMLAFSPDPCPCFFPFDFYVDLRYFVAVKVNGSYAELLVLMAFLRQV